MDIPLQVNFRNMDRSEAVEAPERRHHKGMLFHVRIELGLPGDEPVVSRHPKDKHAHEDVYVAVRDAFDAARRQLEDHARKIDGRVKSHEVPFHGKVLRLFPHEGYGFIAASDGREIYFHKNSVLRKSFDQLEVGSEVRPVMAERESAQGPQAGTVDPIGKHHLVEPLP